MFVKTVPAWFLLFFLASCTVSGSGTIPAAALKTPQALYELGEKRMKNDNPEDARTVFQKIKTLYPLSDYAILAELRIADTYRKEGKFDVAASAYRDFERDHPFHEAVTSGMTTWWIGYCNYRLGPGDFFLFPPAQQRDLLHTRAAYAVFQMFLSRYPDSPYKIKVQKYYRRAREMLVKHEFYAADFYMKKKKYRGVRNRLEFILTQYPDSPRVVDAAAWLIHIYDRLGEEKKAVDLCRKIIEHYPARPQAAQAARLLARIEGRKRAQGAGGEKR